MRFVFCCFTSEMLWVDKHSPKHLEDLSFHKDLNKRFEQLAKQDDLPHLLVYGMSGSGRKTRVRALMSEMFGPTADKLTITAREFETPSGTKFTLHLISSPVHLELNPSDVGSYDRIIVQTLVKEMAQTQAMDVTRGQGKHFKVIVIHEAHNLSRDAQQALRRTMEKYMGNLRIIMIADEISRIMAPIRSRCFTVRVPVASVSDLSLVVSRIASKEKFEVPSEGYLTKVHAHCKGNMRQALLMLEAANVQSGGIFDEKAPVNVTDWEEFVEQVAALVLGDQSQERILLVRSKLYELITHCIPPETILDYMTMCFLKRVDKELIPEIVKQAAIYEHRLKLGSKAIYHLEAYAIRVMAVYREHAMKKRNY
jgi:replication factor C subunit 3/5